MVALDHKGWLAWSNGLGARDGLGKDRGRGCSRWGGFIWVTQVVKESWRGWQRKAGRGNLKRIATGFQRRKSRGCC